MTTFKRAALVLLVLASLVLVGCVGGGNDCSSRKHPCGSNKANQKPPAYKQEGR